MTATEPTLDELLRATSPQEVAPFDLADQLHRWRYGHYESALHHRDAIARHVNAERVKTEDARRWVDRLQGENAALTARIAEAVGLLGDALVFHPSTTDQTYDYISEALAALRGEGR